MSTIIFSLINMGEAIQLDLSIDIRKQKHKALGLDIDIRVYNQEAVQSHSKVLTKPNN
jgi:hypothetical protein